MSKSSDYNVDKLRIQRMLAKANFKQKPFSAGFVILCLIVCNAMRFGESKTIFNELVPDNSSCPLSGEHGCLCYGHSDCNPTKFLECIDGKCVCKFPLRRTFDESLGKCVAMVGSICSGTDRWTPECVRNAECEIGRCFCRGGYSKTSDNKMCLISYGEECGPKQCNADRGLACKEGTCQCIDSSFVYSAILTRNFQLQSSANYEQNQEIVSSL